MNYRFLTGDLNLKIKLQDFEVRQYIDSYNTQKNLNKANTMDTLDYLYKQDELSIMKSYSNLVSKYQE